MDNPHQPGRDLLRIALCRSRQRFLRGKTPPLQIKLHRRQAEALAKFLVDQLPHRLRRPQCEGQLYLIGAFVRNPALHAPRFDLRQHKLITNAPPALSLLDAGRAIAPECPTPTADRSAMHSDSQRRLHVRRALLDKKHSALAKSVLRPLIQFARIA
jgi:hypothetical protein